MNDMKRRLLLQQLGLAALLPVLPYGESDAGERRQSRHVEVLIIGAGMAGLAAARALRAEGVSVQILEARNRIGGRVFTSRGWPDLPMDMGASWIHGLDGNPITKLARAAGARTAVTSYDRSLAFAASGKALSPDALEKLERIQTRVHGALQRAEDAEQDQSAQAAVANIRRDLADDPEALNMLDFVLNSELEQEFGGRAEDLSSYWMDDGAAFDGDDALFPQGYGAVADFVAQGTPIATGQVVRRIDWQDSTLTVHTERDIWTAEQVLVTVPLGVLKAGRIAFTPALPSAKQAAIKALDMGLLNKCFLRFDRVFWPDHVDWLEHLAPTPGQWVEWVSFARAANAPVLLGFHAAAAAHALEAKSDADTVAAAMRVLRRLFGRAIPDPVAWQITRWASDPFALGSYSYYPLGSKPSMRDDLAKPVDDRLFFAGEATSRAYFGTVHGAFLSGERAAEAILAARE